MKLVLFDDYRPGVLRDDGVVDCASLVRERADPNIMTSIVEQWERLAPQFAEVSANASALPLTDIVLRAPIASPGKIMCMAANFREGTDAEPLPINGFIVSPNAILAPGETVIFPRQDFKVCHHEAELVCVIGKAGHGIHPSKAMEHVFGYTAGVDVSRGHRRQ